MEAFYIILGAAAIYSWIHFIVLTFKKPLNKRNNYEVFITFFAIVTLALYIIGSLS